MTLTCGTGAALESRISPEMEARNSCDHMVATNVKVNSQNDAKRSMRLLLPRICMLPSGMAQIVTNRRFHRTPRSYTDWPAIKSTNSQPRMAKVFVRSQGRCILGRKGMRDLRQCFRIRGKEL